MFSPKSAMAAAILSLTMIGSAAALPAANLASAAKATTGIQQARWVCGPFRCFWRPSVFIGPRWGWRRPLYGFYRPRWGWHRPLYGFYRARWGWRRPLYGFYRPRWGWRRPLYGFAGRRWGWRGGWGWRRGWRRW